MNNDLAQHTFYFGMAMLQLSGISAAAYFALSFLLRRYIRANDPLLIELFAFSPMGRYFSKTPWQLSGKYLWPWTRPPGGLNSRPPAVRMLFWATRIAGAAAPLLSLGFLATMVYMGVS